MTLVIPVPKADENRFQSPKISRISASRPVAQTPYFGIQTTGPASRIARSSASGSLRASAQNGSTSSTGRVSVSVMIWGLLLRVV